MANQVKSIPTPDLSCEMTSHLLGSAIRAKRTQNNLRLSDAAALCGVSKQTLSNIENGQETTQLSTILQVCTCLGIKIHIQPWLSSSEAEENEWR